MFDRAFVDEWLAHLRRDSKGRPVPYVNLWGTQTIENTYIQHDPVVGMVAQFVRDEGDVPNFKVQSPQRQRECAVNGLCQICGRPVPWDQCVLVASHRSVRAMEHEGQLVPAFTEPWLDTKCAGVALTWCPALLGLRRDNKIFLLAVKDRAKVLMLVTTGHIDGPLEETTRISQPAFHVNLAVPDAKSLFGFAPQVKP